MSNLFESINTVIANQGIVVLVVAAAASLFLLTRAADFAVDGAVELARTAHVPAAVIGATVVSIGTTLPEVAVSVVAAAGGDSALAVGNATGSIVANIGLIAGVLLVSSRRRVHGRLVLPSALVALAVVTVLAGIVFGTAAAGATTGGSTARVPRVAGVVLIAMLPAYLYLAFRRRDGASRPTAAPDKEGGSVSTRAATVVLTLLRVTGGTLLVVVASRILLPIVVELSRRAGLPESFIAATLVAVGTSLPELSTSIAAARKGELELGLANVAGANIMNVLLVVGLSSVVSGTGLAVDRYLLTQMIPAALALSGGLTLFLVRGRAGRIVGAGLLAAYVAIVTVGLVGV